MWRLSNSEFNSQSGARGRAAEVWADAEILFGKSQERYLFWLAVIRRIKKHLLMIQEQAEERFDLLVEQMASQEGVTEQLKAQDQMLWMQKMNNIRARAEESVLMKLIYQL